MADIEAAVMRDKLPPQRLTPLQIKREAEARHVFGSPETNLWHGVLKPALEADAAILEEWELAQTLRYDDPLIEPLTDALRQAEGSELDISEYKPAFFRAAAIRTPG